MPIASDGNGNFLALGDDGEWTPAKRARNPKTGAELILDGSEWKPLPGSEPSTAGAAARGVIRGATYGFADEIGGAVAGVRGLVSGEGFTPAYERTRDAIRSQDAADAAAHPWVDIGGQVAGGVASALLTRGASAKVGLTARAGQAGAPLSNALMQYIPALSGTTARAVGAGAVSGGLAGFGTGEGGIGNRMENAAEGAAIGGAVSGGVSLATRGATSIGRRVVQAFGGGDPGATSDRLIARSIDRSGATLDDVEARLAARGDNPLALVDVGGRNTQALGAVAANTPSSAMDVADQFAQARRAGRPDRLANMGDQAFGGGSGTDVAEATAARRFQRQTDAEPLYRDAFSRPAGFTDAMGTVLDDPITQSGLARGLEIQRIENTTRAARGGERVPTTDPAIRFDAKGVPRIIGVPNMRSMDAVKRGLDAIIDEARDGTTGQIQWTERLRAIDGLRSQWVRMLDEGNPAYGQARAAWAGPSAQMDATAAGRTAFRTDRDVVAQRMTGAPDVQDAYRLGAGRDFADRVSDPARASGSARAFLEDRQMQARLAAILPEDQMARLNAGLRHEVDMTAVERAVSPRAGSQTGRLLAGAEDMTAAPLGPWATAAALLVSGHPVSATRTVAADQWRRLGQGINPATSDALANKLFSTIPTEQAATIAGVRNRLLTDALQAEVARTRMQPILRGVGGVGGHRNPED